MEDDIVPLHAPFDVALRGFERNQVLDHLESLHGKIAMAERDRDAAFARVADMSKHVDQLRSEGSVLAYLQRQTDAANEQLRRMRQSPIPGVTDRIQHMLTLAEEEAAEVRSQATAEAEQLRSKTATESEQLRSKTATESEQLRIRAETEATTLRKRSQAEAERLSQDMTQRCERREAASQQRCQEAEQRCEQEIARRQAEATAQIAEQEKRGLARMLLMMQAVSEQVQAARHEIATLRTLRGDLAAQLAAADQSLTAALGHIEDSVEREPRRESEPVPMQRQRALDNARA